MSNYIQLLETTSPSDVFWAFLSFPLHETPFSKDSKESATMTSDFQKIDSFAVPLVEMNLMPTQPPPLSLASQLWPGLLLPLKTLTWLKVRRKLLQPSPQIIRGWGGSTTYWPLSPNRFSLGTSHLCSFIPFKFVRGKCWPVLQSLSITFRMWRYLVPAP